MPQESCLLQPYFASTIHWLATNLPSLCCFMLSYVYLFFLFLLFLDSWTPWLTCLHLHNIMHKPVESDGLQLARLRHVTIRCVWRGGRWVFSAARLWKCHGHGFVSAENNSADAQLAPWDWHHAGFLLLVLILCTSWSHVPSIPALSNHGRQHTMISEKFCIGLE